MDWSRAVVIHLPLAALWTDDGPLSASRRRAVGRDEVAALLRAGPVRFVVADVGHRLRWVPADACFTVWKDEVKPRILDADVDTFRLEDFPGGVAYLASEWDGRIVLLEVFH